MSKLSLRKKGFTLIEIVIVLAIAALILVIVLLAVGAAQRAQRDRTTQDAAAKVIAATLTYYSDNGGSLPTSVGTGQAIPNTDNSTGYFLNIRGGKGDSPQAKADAGTAVATKDKRLIYGLGNICDPDGKTTTVTNAGKTNIAVSYWSESKGEAICKDNS